MSKIGIIGAMELEVEALKAEMSVSRIIEKASMKFFEGTLGKAEVVVVQCGIGKVNAGMCVQILADCFHVTHIINTGVAGSLNADLDIGDIVIGTEAVYHDMDVTSLGYETGQVPGLSVKYFPADETMIQAAKASCEKVNKDIHVKTGRVASGDQFISSKEVKENILKTVGGDCTEMEGAAIAHAAFLNEIPFVIIRAISDKADDSAHMDYPSFEKAAAAHCSALVMDFIQELAD